MISCSVVGLILSSSAARFWTPPVRRRAVRDPHLRLDCPKNPPGSVQVRKHRVGDGYQTLDYAYWKRRGEIADLVPLSEIAIKAEIARPAQGEIISANSKVRIHGAAWTSDDEITKVEVSTDGGSVWSEAKLIGAAKRNAWRLWEFDWKTPSKPGKQKLIARATDSQGRTQPIERDPDRGTYMINHLLPITVEVR